MAPRIFLRKLVADVLDRVAEFPDFDPAQALQADAVRDRADRRRAQRGGVPRLPRPPRRRGTGPVSELARDRIPRSRTIWSARSAGPSSRPAAAGGHRAVSCAARRAPAGADGRREDRGGCLPGALPDGGRRLDRPVGAIPVPVEGAAQQPLAAAGDLRRLDGPAGRPLARRHHCFAQRESILAGPPDLLLTTPESLESMLVSANVDHRGCSRTFRRSSWTRSTRSARETGDGICSPSLNG